MNATMRLKNKAVLLFGIVYLKIGLLNNLFIYLFIYLFGYLFIYWYHLFILQLFIYFSYNSQKVKAKHFFHYSVLISIL